MTSEEPTKQGKKQIIIRRTTPWLLNGEPLTEIPEGYVGFVYLMTHVETGKSYIGQKSFYKTAYKTINGKRKRIKVESDWKDYVSSSLEVQSLADQGNEFIREVLHLCESKGKMNYLEAREQFDRRVLEDSHIWFNGQIRCRVHRSHLKKLES